MGYPARGLGVLVAVIALFVGARWVAGPAYLDLFDPDRSQNVAEWAGKPVQYLSLEGCDGCHGERMETWQGAAHQGLSCETCHGQASDHVASGASIAVEKPQELCLRCHARLESRPASHPQVDVEEHAGPIECTACHNPHDPGQGAPPNVPHSLEGRVGSCTVCHAPTGVKTYPENHVGRTSDMCLGCHQSPESGLYASTQDVPAQEDIQPSGPPNIPHTLDGRSECTACHGEGGFKPFPADHAGRTSEICLACHRQQ